MAHFFYINPEFETCGASIWTKKLNLGTPNVSMYYIKVRICLEIAFPKIDIAIAQLTIYVHGS